MLGAEGSGGCSSAALRAPLICTFPSSLFPLPSLRPRILGRMRCDEIRLTGSGGANRVMEAELKRLVMRSPFEVRVPKPKREGEATLLYPFDPRIAWVAACHHRTSSRISWDLFSSEAVRLEPLFEELLPALTADDRLPDRARPCASRSTLARRRTSKPRRCSCAAWSRTRSSRRWRRAASTADVDADAPDIVFVARRAGTPESRRTVVGIDIGGGARHRRGARVAAGPAPLRETMAAQLIMLSRWDARSEPLVDPMAGGGTIPIEAAGLAVGAAIRHPSQLPFHRLAAFAGLPNETPDLFPGRCRGFLRSTSTRSASRRWSATCAQPASPARATRTRSSSARRTFGV